MVCEQFGPLRAGNKNWRSSWDRVSEDWMHAMAFATDTLSLTATLGDRFSMVRAAMADRYTKYQVFRTTVSELSCLSDRDLADLGIHRTEIGEIARNAANGAK